jgi:hypothetical protein
MFHTMFFENCFQCKVSYRIKLQYTTKWYNYPNSLKDIKKALTLL